MGSLPFCRPWRPGKSRRDGGREAFEGQVRLSMKEAALVQDIRTGASPPRLLSSSQAEPLQPSLAADGEDKRWGAGMPRLTPGIKR